MGDDPAVRPLFHSGGVEVPALGGEVEQPRVLVPRNGAAHVACQVVPAGQHRAGGGIQAQQRGGIAEILILAVVGSHQQVVVADVSARPVEAALGGVGPAGQLLLAAAVGVFIGGGQADVVGVQILLIPEAGINIALVIRQRAVGLAAQRVMVDPQRLERRRVEGLHDAVAEGHEQHAVLLAVGGGVDGKAGGIAHGAGGHHRTGDGFHPIELGAAVDDQELQAALLDENGAAYRVGAIAVAQLVGPAEHRVLPGDGRLDVHHAVGVVIAPEGGPVRGHAHSVMGIGRRLQLNGEGLVLRSGDDVQRLAHISGAGGHAGVGEALHQLERTVRFGPDTGAAALVIDGGQRTCDGLAAEIRHGDRGGDGLALFQRQGIGMRLLPAFRAGGEGDGLLLLVIQCQRDGDGIRYDPGIRVGLRRIAHAVNGHAVALERNLKCQRRRLCRAEDRGVIVIDLVIEDALRRDLAGLHLIDSGVRAVHGQGGVAQRQHLGQIDPILLIEGNAPAFILARDIYRKGGGLWAIGYTFGDIGNILFAVLQHGFLAVGTLHRDGLPFSCGGSREQYSVHIVDLGGIQVLCRFEVRGVQIDVALVRGAGGQLQTGQMILRFRRDSRDGQRCVAVRGSGKGALCVVVCIFCGDIGIAVVAGGQGIGAVVILADLRTGRIIDLYAYARVMGDGEGDGLLPRHGQRIDGAASAVHGNGDLGGGGVCIQGEGIGAVTGQGLAVDRNGIVPSAGRAQHDVLGRNGAGVVRFGAGKADALVHAAGADVQAGEGGCALQCQLPRLTHGIAVHSGACLDPHLTVLGTAVHHVCQRLLGGYPFADKLGLAAVDVGIYRPDTHLAALPLVLLIQTRTGHGVEIQAHLAAHGVGQQDGVAVIFRGVGVLFCAAAADGTQHRLADPADALGHPQGIQRLSRHGDSAVLRHRQSAGGAVITGGQGKGIITRRQGHGIIRGKALLVAVGILCRKAVVRQGLAVQAQKGDVQLHHACGFILRIGVHPVRQSLGQGIQLLDGLFRRQGLRGGVVLLLGEPLQLGLFRLLPRQHGAAQRVQRRRGILVQIVVSGQEQERVHIPGALIQIVAAFIVAAEIAGRNAVNGGNIVALRQAGKGMGTFCLQRQQRVLHGLSRRIGHALRGDDDLGVIGGQQQEAVVLGQLRVSALLLRDALLRGRRYILRRSNQLCGPCGGQQGQGHDQRHEKRYNPFFHPLFLLNTCIGSISGTASARASASGGSFAACRRQSTASGHAGSR